MYVHTYVIIYHSVEDERASCWHGPTGHAASSEGRRRLSFGQDLSNACDGRLVEPPSSINRFGQKGCCQCFDSTITWKGPKTTCSNVLVHANDLVMFKRITINSDGQLFSGLWYGWYGLKNAGMLGCSSFPQVMEGARAGDLGRALQRAKQVALRAAVGW